MQRYANLCTAGSCQDAQRLSGSVAVKECILFSSAHPSCKLSGDVSFDIEYGILQQLIGYEAQNEQQR